MAAPKGNRFWEARAKHGRDKVFTDSEAMWEAACDYFAWVNDNPLEEGIVYQGVVNEEQAKPLMRAMTIEGLCIFWGVNSKYLSQFEGELDLATNEGKDFSNIICNIRDVIRTQKFEGAAAGLLNPNIIARDLGLKDESKHEHTGANGGAIQHDHIVEFVGIGADQDS